MESRKQLYKSTKDVTTMSARMKTANTNRRDNRKNAFAANRGIAVDLDDSISTPPKPVPTRISQIKDKKLKLKTYIERKRSAKLQEAIENRSPFIPYVPVGRWVEKKEDPVLRQKKVQISTPVRKALMTDGKIFRKPTFKDMVSTAKKDASVRKALSAVGSKKAEPNVRTRKKILVEPNEVPFKSPEDAPVDLNSTFEVQSSPEETNKIVQAENVVPVPMQAGTSKAKKPKKIEQQTKSVARDAAKKKPLKKTVSEPVKKIAPVVEKKPVAAAKIAMPVKRKPPTATIVKPIVPIQAPKSPQPQALPVLSPQPPSWSPQNVSSSATAPSTKEPSRVYQFHKSCLDNQRSFITLQLKGITDDLDSYIDTLSEDTQAQFRQNIQLGNKIVNEKMTSFMEFLEKFENADETDVKRVTEEDVENYWELLFEEIEKIKEELIVMRETKSYAQKTKKRRTTRVVDVNVTPRRSRRIADQGDTPNHSCFGCTPVSSSKVNTPKSIKRRRTLFKNKELSFD